MSSQKIVLILGSGPNIGHHVSRAFFAKGYKVVVASRSVKQDDDNSDEVHFQVDLSDPASVPALFAKVKEAVGIPSVVVYNASIATANDPSDTFSLSLDQFTKDLNINVTSPYVAAKEAVQGFAHLPASASKTFIYTGNICNNKVAFPPMMTLGVGKSATAHMVQNAAMVYADQGYKFYYADERKADGSPMYMEISGPGHGKHYVELSEGEKQGPWQQTFVTGEGYKTW